jgi:hypothetical protein
VPTRNQILESFEHNIAQFQMQIKKEEDASKRAALEELLVTERALTQGNVAFPLSILCFPILQHLHHIRHFPELPMSFPNRTGWRGVARAFHALCCHCHSYRRARMGGAAGGSHGGKSGRRRALAKGDPSASDRHQRGCAHNGRCSNKVENKVRPSHIHGRFRYDRLRSALEA